MADNHVLCGRRESICLTPLLSDCDSSWECLKPALVQEYLCIFLFGTNAKRWLKGLVSDMNGFLEWHRITNGTRNNPQISAYFSFSTIAGALGGLIAYVTFANLQNVHGLASWQWLFIIVGAPTIVAGLISFKLLPD